MLSTGGPALVAVPRRHRGHVLGFDLAGARQTLQRISDIGDGAALAQQPMHRRPGRMLPSSLLLRRAPVSRSCDRAWLSRLRYAIPAVPGRAPMTPRSPSPASCGARSTKNLSKAKSRRKPPPLFWRAPERHPGVKLDRGLAIVCAEKQGVALLRGRQLLRALTCLFRRVGEPLFE
jgi:hypothetical protein